MPNTLFFTTADGEQLWGCVLPSNQITKFYSCNPGKVCLALYKDAQGTDDRIAGIASSLLAAIAVIGIDFIED